MKRASFFSYRRLWVFTTDLEALAALPSDISGRFEFAWIHDEADVNRTAEITRKKIGLYVSTMQTTLAAGGRIAVALEGGTPVAMQMFRPQDQVTIPWLRVHANDAVLSYGTYIAHAWRGHRLMTRLTKFAAATYADQKFRRVCSMAQPCNKAAVRGHLNRGDRSVGWITALRLARGPIFVASDRRIDCGFFNPSNPFVYTVRD
jgi:hypothetical protein